MATPISPFATVAEWVSFRKTGRCVDEWLRSRCSGTPGVENLDASDSERSTRSPRTVYSGCEHPRPRQGESARLYRRLWGASRSWGDPVSSIETVVRSARIGEGGPCFSS